MKRIDIRLDLTKADRPLVAECEGRVVNIENLSSKFHAGQTIEVPDFPLDSARLFSELAFYEG